MKTGKRILILKTLFLLKVSYAQCSNSKVDLFLPEGLQTTYRYLNRISISIRRIHSQMRVKIFFSVVHTIRTSFDMDKLLLQIIEVY